LNTGSPHHVQLVDLENYNIKEKTEPLLDTVICMEKLESNINFVKQIDDATFSLRTGG
jgi:diaminopimelate epimerase